MSNTMQAKHISIFILKSICISLLLAVQTSVMAQKPKLPMQQQPDTTRLFRHIAVSVDLVGMAQMQLSDYGQIEVAARLNLKDKYFPVVELGYGKADSENPGTLLHYTSKAPYGRIGIDFNTMKNKHDDYRMYAGFRFAYSNFKYSVHHPGLIDPVWKTRTEYRLNDIGNQFSWLEAVFGVDAKIWGPFRLGWSVRYRARLSYKAEEVGYAWYVPGYGRQKSNLLSGTFNVTLEL